METAVTKSDRDSFWYWIGLWWFWTRRTIGILIFTFLGWEFLELIGPGRVIREAVVEEIQSSFPFNLLVKESPIKTQEEARKRAVEVVQAHCRHVTHANGSWNYFCPLCGKKLLDRDPHPWQI